MIEHVCFVYTLDFRVTLLHSIYKAQPVNQGDVVGFIVGLRRWGLGG